MTRRGSEYLRLYTGRHYGFRGVPNISRNCCLQCAHASIFYFSPFQVAPPPPPGKAQPISGMVINTLREVAAPSQPRNHRTLVSIRGIPL